VAVHFTSETKSTKLYDLRLHRLEQLTSSMVECQASMVQILQDQSARLERIGKRLDRIEKQQTLILDDLGFIKTILTARE